MNPQHSSHAMTGGLAGTAVPPLALLSGIGMILVALGFAAYVWRRQLGWGAFWLGALAWGVTVAFKFACACLCNPPLYVALNQALPTLGVPLFTLYVGALTGIFEIGLVALLLNYTRLGKATWPRTIAFGIGFGAIEALLLGLLSLSSILATMLISMVAPQTPEVLVRLGTFQWVIAPVVERLAAVFIHICSNVLIFYAVNTRQRRWFWLAFGYKTVVDGMAAAFVHINGIDTLGRAWAFEGLILLFAVAGWLGLRWLAPRYQALSIKEVVAPPRLTQALDGVSA